MPRLTNQQYLERRRTIVRDWYERDGGCLWYLTSDEQRDLHDYFGTTKQLDLSSALTYRDKITKQRPSLPQLAGKAYANLETARRFVPRPASTVRVPKAQRRIQVSPLVRPEIDVHRLARALMKMAEQDKAKGL